MATTDDGRMDLEYLEKLLCKLHQHAVHDYTDGDFHISLTPHEAQAATDHVVATTVPSDEEVLFWSSGGMQTPAPQGDPDITPKG